MRTCITDQFAANSSGNRAGHFVRFFDDGDFLDSEVRSFLRVALEAGRPSVFIATPRRIATVTNGLPAFGIAASIADWQPGQLLALDAEETLSLFMMDGWPQADLFASRIGGIFEAAAAMGAGHVNAFGEMVAILCEQGRYEAAIRLEELWNEIAAKYDFDLFCAYPAKLFANSEYTRSFRCVCEAHTQVRLSERLTAAKSSDDAERLVASWQQKAAALEEEILRRKAAEAALRQREEELSDFLENAVEGLHKVGGDGTILWANRAELEMLGYAYDEYVGRHIAEFHVDQHVIESVLSKLAAGECLRDQPARLRCKDGSIKHVLIHSNGRMEGSKLAYTRCFTRDATERVAREQAEDQLHRVLTNAPVGAALLVGPDLRFSLANRRYCEMVGRHDLVGKPLADALPAWSTEEVVRQIRYVITSGNAFTAEEFCIGANAAGSERDERYYKFNLEPYQSLHGGAVEGVIAVIVDLTEEVRTRRAMERSFVEREQLLTQLRDASRSKDEFLAMLGHELRNPLSPIVTALQLMRMRGDTGTEREQAIIQRQVQHLIRLIDDLLDISKITRGKIELKKEWVSISEVLTRAVEMSTPLLEQRHHRLSVDMAERLHLHADGVRLAQVLGNLLTNAARYTDAGGDIVVRANRIGEDDIEISVKDTGVGIAADVLPKVFDMFYQGARNPGRLDGGLGIGLTLVKSLVLLHGGSVRASSDGAGRGSEFVVRVPIACSDASSHLPAAVAEDGSAEARRLKSDLRVLLVDDNADAANTLAELLRATGAEVVVAHDPPAAIERVGTFLPDIAILDIGLPVMDGYELLGHMQKNESLAACKYVALTGYGQEADRHRSKMAGFHEHFTKPIDPTLLLAYVWEVSKPEELRSH